jgi:flagellin
LRVLEYSEVDFRQLGVNQSNASKSMERLSSGMRINRAGDDAAGLAISEKMRGQIRGLKQAARNAQDGISLIQTAEGALNETHSILQRMRELATQAATDTNTLTDRKEIQKEINQLLDEIDRIADKTTFNTQEILDGTYEGKIFHIGANEGDNMEISIGSMKTDALGGGTAVGGATPGGEAGNAVGIGTIAGVEVTITGGTDEAYDGVEVVFTKGGTAGAAWVGNTLTVTLDETSDAIDADTVNNLIENATGTAPTGVDTLTVAFDGDIDGTGSVSGSVTLALDEAGANIASLKVENVDSVTEADVANGTAGGVLTQDGANKAITNINDAIEQVSAERSKLGAIQNRLEHTIANLGTSAENLQAAEARIRDLDMAEEIMAFTKNNILQQAATAMLAQANMAPQSVLQLLG